MRRKTGWTEWADRRVSLYTGCTHGCRYCFARADALRFKRIEDATEWERPKIREREVARKWTRIRGVIGFPGTHDITPENVTRCGALLEGMLAAGNKVLIVTKPHVACVEHLCQRLRMYREQIEFRMMIGAEDDALLGYWEPRAPRFDERMEAACLACASEYRVSFSVEPMLDPSNIRRLLGELRPFAQSIWIGKMNEVRRRVIIETEADRLQVERIERWQRDERIMDIVRALAGDPIIRWKDSIRGVITRSSELAL